MDNSDVKQIFGQLVDDEPALPDIGPYVIAAQSGRRRRRLSYAAAGTLAGVALVAAVLVVPTMVVNARSGPAAGRSLAGSAGAADPQQAHAAKLTAALQKSQAQWLPSGATLKERVEGWPLGTQVRPGAGDGSWELTFTYRLSKSVWNTFPDGLTSDDKDKLAEIGKAPFDGVDYGAGALVANSGHLSKLSVSVSPVNPGQAKCPPAIVRADACVESTTADGDTLIVVDAPGLAPNPDADWKLREVRLIRSDGSMVSVGEYTATQGPPGIQSDGEYALTIDELKQIALLPGLVYKYQPK